MLTISLLSVDAAKNSYTSAYDRMQLISIPHTVANFPSTQQTNGSDIDGQPLGQTVKCLRGNGTR